MKIKIVSGYTDTGGSTVAFINLTNLFNENGVDTTFYGPHEWPKNQCKYENISEVGKKPNDRLITHFLSFPSRPKANKVILSCHETKLFPIKSQPKYWDNIHFVSKFQKDWQQVDGVVIPNVIQKIDKHYIQGMNKPRVAGIIGSIDKNKRTHLSIQRALKDKFWMIEVIGKITDFEYFQKEVCPLLGIHDNENNLCKKSFVSYNGISNNMNEVYSRITHVYHSPLLETYNMIKPECEAAGVIYCGMEGNDTQAEYWSRERIFEEWMKLLK